MKHAWADALLLDGPLEDAPNGLHAIVNSRSTEALASKLVTQPCEHARGEAVCVFVDRELEELAQSQAHTLDGFSWRAISMATDALRVARKVAAQPCKRTAFASVSVGNWKPASMNARIMRSYWARFSGVPRCPR